MKEENVAPAAVCFGVHGVHNNDVGEMILCIAPLKGNGCHDVCLIKRDV